MSEKITRPEKEFRAKGIKASVWARAKVSSAGREYVDYSTSITKSYVGDDDKWHETTSFFTSDLPALGMLAHMAYKYIMLKETE